MRVGGESEGDMGCSCHRSPPMLGLGGEKRRKPRISLRS